MGKNTNKDLEIKQMIPPTGKALIYVFRPQWQGKVSKMKIKCNGVDIASTKGKQFIYLILDPGNYTFASICENKSELDLSIEANNTYYVYQELLRGAWKPRTKLELADEINGRKDLEKCSLIKTENINVIPSMSQYQAQMATSAAISSEKEYLKGTALFACTLGGIISILLGLFLSMIYPEVIVFLGIFGTILQICMIIGGFITFIGVVIMLFNPELGKSIIIIGGLLGGVNILTIIGAAAIRPKIE